MIDPNITIHSHKCCSGHRLHGLGSCVFTWYNNNIFMSVVWNFV